MTQNLVTVAIFIGLLCALPFGLARLKTRRTGLLGLGGGSPSRLLSAVAVGPQQRVVTVEVGPEQARVWLVLGVTGQSINCLHALPAAPQDSASHA